MVIQIFRQEAYATSVIHHTDRTELLPSFVSEGDDLAKQTALGICETAL